MPSARTAGKGAGSDRFDEQNRDDDLREHADDAQRDFAAAGDGKPPAHVRGRPKGERNANDGGDHRPENGNDQRIQQPPKQILSLRYIDEGPVRVQESLQDGLGHGPRRTLNPFKTNSLDRPIINRDYDQGGQRETNPRTERGAGSFSGRGRRV